jgi:hypothetical protein
MRLSEWRSKSPVKDAGGPKVAAVVDAVIVALGAEPDPHCWVAWGEDPSIRYTILIPTEPGLISSFVRINVPGEGPRATTKLIRWSRVSIGELTVETQAGHRLLSFQVEQQVLRGADEDADRVAAFALRVIAAIDGRSIPPDIERKGRAAPRMAKAPARTPTRSGGATRSAGTGATSKAAASKATALKTGRSAVSTATSRTAARGPGR